MRTRHAPVAKTGFWPRLYRGRPGTETDFYLRL